MNNIDYSKIDEKCIPLVKLFNHLGLETRLCCQGHDNDKSNRFYVSFENSVKGEQIIELLMNFENKYNSSPFQGKFSKWHRKIKGKIESNWFYTLDTGNFRLNQIGAQRDYILMSEYYNFKLA